MASESLKTPSLFDEILKKERHWCPPCSLRRWNCGDPNRLFFSELRRVLQWAELLAAMPLPPPGLEGGVKESEPTPTLPPSAREEEEEEEEEGGVAVGGWG